MHSVTLLVGARVPFAIEHPTHDSSFLPLLQPDALLICRPHQQAVGCVGSGAIVGVSGRRRLDLSQYEVQ